MKRILITGSNGLLGQKLSDLFLAQSGVEWLATARGENRHPAGEGMPYQALDIADFDQTRAVLEAFKPDAVIHTAAMTQVDDCETQRERCWSLNVEAVAHLAKLSSELGFHLVHVSTDFIFDGTKPMYGEEDPANPLSYYGESKWEGEKRVMEWASSYSILRTVLVYGRVADMSRSNIVLWAHGALKKGQTMRVVGDQFRTPTLAEDLAMGCWLAADQKAQGIFNIAGKDYMSVIELVRRVAAFYQLSDKAVQEVDSSTLNQPAKRPPITGLDISKAVRELGYAPHSFEEGLALMQLD
jgi:dTDP-4-dehydrorhamnose reductase